MSDKTALLKLVLDIIEYRLCDDHCSPWTNEGQWQARTNCTCLTTAREILVEIGHWYERGGR
jgi:hypothetical protein